MLPLPAAARPRPIPPDATPPRMPLEDAALLAVAVAAVALLTAWRRVDPFLTLVAATIGFALAEGMSVAHVGKAFGTGFGLTAAAVGLAVLAAAMLAELANISGGAARLADLCRRMRESAGTAVLARPLGFLAGLGASAAVGYAITAPLRGALSGAPATGAETMPAPARRAALSAGLSLSAAHALVLPAPPMIAAVSILGAGWSAALTLGLPVAIATAVVGLVFVRLAAAPLSTAPAVEAAMEGATAGRAGAPRGVGAGVAAAVLVLLTLALVGLTVVQSLGDIPSEPFGGGRARETLLGAGRPLLLLAIAVTVMGLATLAFAGRRDGAAAGWASRAMRTAALPMLMVAAAGGLQTVTQQPGMAELLGEKVLALPYGVLVPFLAAAIVKTLQGSTLVAAITAAGMTEALLAPLGLDGETGRALAALAIGAGSVTVGHINDPLFWLIAGEARLKPWQGLALVTGGLAVQGAAAAAMLMALAAVLA
jgi:GntP family gluconate:H+ symporter